MIHYRMIFALLLALGLSAMAHATPLVVQGEWETTATINAPQGPMAFHTKNCNKGQDVSQVMPKQANAHCKPWQESSSNGGRDVVLRGECTQNGPTPGQNMLMHVEAKINIAEDGRSLTGTTQASGEVNGFTFSSPPTQFSAKYIGACTTH